MVGILSALMAFCFFLRECGNVRVIHIKAYNSDVNSWVWMEFEHNINSIVSNNSMAQLKYANTLEKEKCFTKYVKKRQKLTACTSCGYKVIKG